MAKKRAANKKKAASRGRGAPRVDPDTSTWRGRFAVRLRELCDRRDVSAKELAEALGVGLTTVWEWQRGRRSPNVDRLPEIAEVLRVKPSELVPD